MAASLMKDGGQPQPDFQPLQRVSAADQQNLVRERGAEQQGQRVVRIGRVARGGIVIFVVIRLVFIARQEAAVFAADPLRRERGFKRWRKVFTARSMGDEQRVLAGRGGGVRVVHLRDDLRPAKEAMERGGGGMQ